MPVNNCLFILSTPPHGSAVAQETLDVILMYSAFGVPVTLLFIGDGIFQLKKNQSTAPLQLKNFSAIFRAMKDYDIDNVYADESAMTARSIQLEDLLIDVTPLDMQRQRQLIESADLVFNLS